MNHLLTHLDEAMAAMGLDANPQQQIALLAYLGLLSKWNRTYNLTAIHEPERMLTHHLLDSLAILPAIGAGPLLDVGSGGGLPGIPLAIVRPDLEITLMDASQKKCGFMQQVVIELQLKRVRVVHGRVEALVAGEGFPQIVSRAFSELNTFVSLTHHALAQGGEWLAMKGLYPNEEIAQLQGARIKQDIKLHVPGLEADRHLIVMEEN